MKTKIVFSCLLLALVGCDLLKLASAPPTATPTPTLPAVAPTATPTLVQPSPTASPTAGASPTPTRTPTRAPAGLPADPRAITFKASDGQELKGAFFPAANRNAPVVVLMHWAGGDQSDWMEIAFWLQNRGLGGKTPNPKKFPWLNPAWFPKVPQGQSLNVFIFTYRGCGATGCSKGSPAGWLLDSQAGLKTASELEGVDPQRIAAAGASIGADGAVDGCFWLNAQKGKGLCRGGFSLSPGNYLTIPYVNAVKPLQAEQPPKPVRCLFGEQDRESLPPCKAAAGTAYRAIAFSGNVHGMMLIDPKVSPNVLQLMLDWLKVSLGL